MGANTSIRVLIPTRWESIPGLLKRFTNSGSEQRRKERKDFGEIEPKRCRVKKIYRRI
jgi:hypothetical protein